MKANYVQKGDSINYINKGEKTVYAGDVVALGKRVGVAGCDIPTGVLGSMHVVGVFSFPKANSATDFAIGDEVFYGEAEGGALTQADGGEAGVRLGWAVEASPSGMDTVLVKL